MSAIARVPRDEVSDEAGGLPSPYLLFLGDTVEPGYAKTAFGLRDWVGERCVGEFALAGAEGLKHCRTPEIMADAAYAVFNKPSRDFSGQFLIDDTFLYGEGVRDFDHYKVDPAAALMPDFFVPEDSAPPKISDWPLSLFSWARCA